MDDRETDATILHDKLLPLQKRALWYLARYMGKTELQCVCEDFLRAGGETGIDPGALKDIIDFWYVR